MRKQGKTLYKKCGNCGDMDNFTDTLKQRNLEEVRKHTKADLHNHFVLGGSRSFLFGCPYPCDYEAGRTECRVRPAHEP